MAPTGTPLTVYRDRDRGESFYYTLLVPADAHGLFPCFDQPDLKAPYRLELHCPDGWQALGNAPLARDPEGSDQGTVWTFRETEALPTYLFAFAAGPFDVIERSDRGEGAEAEDLLGEGVKRLTDAYELALGPDIRLAATIAAERRSWDLYYEAIDALEARLDLWAEARMVIESTRVA